MVSWTRNPDIRDMNTVQIAIRDRNYAEALRELLIADGDHEVRLVECPNLALDGVIVAEAMTAPHILGPDAHRYVAFTRNANFGSNPLWRAGVRHLIQADCPPRLGRLAIIAVERKLKLARQDEETLNDRLLTYVGHSDAFDRVRGELRPLREAIAAAVWHSTEVMNAMNVLRRLNLEVQIEIDAIVVDSRSREWISTPAENASASYDMSVLGSDDKEFLESLGISSL